jgi:hypothetical protein
LAWEAGYTPNGIKDYLTSDTPVLGLRVNSFTYKTIIVLHWQHVAFDALGMQYVVEGWNAMLWGKEADIPMPCGVDSDPFHPLAQGDRGTTEPHLLADKQVGIGGMIKWGLGYGVDMLVRAKENRMVCVPETYWRPQLQKALEELRAEAVEEGKDPSKVFLTEGDILTAWTMRCVVSPMGMDPDRTVGWSCELRICCQTWSFLTTIYCFRSPDPLPCRFAKPSKAISSLQPPNNPMSATRLGGPTCLSRRATSPPSH